MNAVVVAVSALGVSNHSLDSRTHAYSTPAVRNVPFHTDNIRHDVQLVVMSFLPSFVRNPLKHVVSKVDLPYASQIVVAIVVALLAGNICH